ncbi:DUF2141 domain-containing protein [Sphingomonas hengshuiensis]|uniref:DUF2141 domain-containing protein n=1 Tax=Sphingomonas hengshuiensis TaxID=1609977 RepID=A0A7U4JA86_9SPHN|nr:DUF2141 domain-containing protein [Sphingomonas hengshuiensis]AJP73096.1 hypothetical protein TS85_16790 [Sphingomonas hengshuiensis]
MNRTRVVLVLALGMGILPVTGATAAAELQDPVDGSCAIGTGPQLRVNVVGLKDRSGRLKVEIYPPNEADFLRDDRDLKAQGKQMRRVWAPTPASGPVSVCIRAPAAGQWALLFTHDRDGKNKFNFWQDGAGFPSNQKLGRSRPKVRQALVNIPAQGGQITVHAQYLRGLGGFGPIDD